MKKFAGQMFTYFFIFWGDKMGGGCWGYREPIERDESWE